MVQKGSWLGVQMNAISLLGCAVAESGLMVLSDTHTF